MTYLLHLALLTLMACAKVFFSGLVVEFTRRRISDDIFRWTDASLPVLTVTYLTVDSNGRRNRAPYPQPQPPSAIFYPFNLFLIAPP
jgi:hypothetical protein